MQTDVITVTSRGSGIQAALAQAEKVAAYKGLAGKSAVQLRLLTEEMMGLIRSITGAAEGSFWMEDEDGEYRLHLKVRTYLNEEKREQLLGVSTSGKNESAKGLMGRLRAFFDPAVEEASLPLYFPDMYDHSASPLLDWEWSMRSYENALSTQVEQHNPGAQEAWDELEKSVVKNVADDVKVYIRSGVVEMVIQKKLA